MKMLVGDIGGTHARLAIAQVHSDSCSLLNRRDYDSAPYDGLAPIVERFQQDVNERLQHACFAVPCPVGAGVCHMPNLGWQLDPARVADELGMEDVHIINDFDAQGHALAVLHPGDFAVLQQGSPRPRGPIAVIGAGTGLGQGFLFWEVNGYRVHPSEGGHTDFAPRTQREAELFVYLLDRFGHVSYERVLSGPGLVNVYEFLRSRAAKRSAELERAITRGDAAAVIAEWGLERRDPLAVEALDIFADVYGAQAGNLVLALRADGGVYVTGGIAPQIIQKLKDGTFMRAFHAKGRMTSLLEQVPVRVVMNEDAGLLGAAAALRRSTFQVNQGGPGEFRMTKSNNE